MNDRNQSAADADLAFRMQKWPRVLFKDEARSGGLLSEALERRESATWPALCRELFGRLYGTGTTRIEEPVPGNEWAEELHRQADAVPEWAALQAATGGDAWRAGLGAAQVAEVLAASLPELPEDNAGELQAEAELLGELGQAAQAAKLNEQIKAAKAAGERVLEQLQKGQGFAVRSMLRKAAQNAQREIESVENALAGLGAGSEVAPVQRRAMALMCARDPRLKRIAELAGRLRMQAARKQREKVSQERREVVAVTKGNDLQRLLASEVGMLAIPATRPLVLERIADKRALQYELGGKATKTRGPIIFLIDNSGSMNQNGRHEWAKACALAMMEVARIQKRAFAVCFFNAWPAESFKFDAGEADQDRLLQVLSVCPGGGTNIATAVAWAQAIVAGTSPEVQWPSGKDADVVLVTDGEDGSDVALPVAALKELHASLYTICIECAPSEALQAASTETLHITPRDMVSASAKLDGLFSI